MLIVGVIEIVAELASAINREFSLTSSRRQLAVIIINLLLIPRVLRHCAWRDFGLLLAALALGGVEPQQFARR